MPTNRKTYTSAAKRFQREQQKLIDRATRENIAALRDVRREIAERLVDGQTINTLPYFRRQTQSTFRSFGNILEKKLDRQLERAWRLGMEAVDGPLRKAGHGTRVGGLPVQSFDAEKLQRYREEVRDTIQNIAADGARRVNNAATFGTVGNRDPKQIISDVGRYVTRGAMKKVKAQVESMTKTETARIFNLSMRDRLKQAGKEIKGTMKFWQHIEDNRVRPAHREVGVRTNPDFGGKPIKYNDDFKVGGERAFAPLDPRLSDGNSYGCRCALGFFVEEEKSESGFTRPLFGERGF